MGHIYAGGDNCGVYMSDDNGQHWDLWNTGLNDPDLRMTSYVEDLIVVPHRDGVADSYEGVYAATRGGIAHRPTSGGGWQVETFGPRFTYRSGNHTGIGGPIPYASLAFDENAGVLYAGAGDGRLQSYTSSGLYPETEANGEYSLWRKAIGTGGDGIWRQVESFGDRDAVFQIAILYHPDGTTNPFVASRQGLWLEVPGGSGWQQLLSDDIINQRFGPDRSGLTVGVGIGKNGTIYGLARREGDLDPGVYACEATLVGDRYTYTSAPVELESTSVPPHDWSWADIVHTSSPQCDLRTISVIPGDESSALDDDEVFVGMTLGETYNGDVHYNGYFRWGISLDGVVRWANVLYRDEPWNSAFDIDHTFAYVTEVIDESTVVEQTITSDMGWLGAFAVGSTVAWHQQAYGPVGSQTELAFVPLAHYPLARGDLTDPAEWSQRYTQLASGPSGVNGFYRSRGLNIMSGRALAFTPAGELLIGCGDFTAFISPTGDGSAGFRWLDPYHPARRDCRDLEAIVGPSGTEIFAVKGAPINWDTPTTQWFGYETGPSSSTPGATVCRQQMVIARSVDGLDGMVGEDGYRWDYCSNDFDAYMSAGYEVVDIEFMGSDLVFAAVKGTSHIDGNAPTNGPGRESVVFMGTRLGTTHDWDWSVLWDSASEAGSDFAVYGKAVRKLQVIPGTRRLLIATTNADLCLFEYMIPLDGEPVRSVWVDREDAAWTAIYPEEHRLTRSLKNITGLECDADGQFLYVACSGQDYWSGSSDSDRRYCANVLRVAIPAEGSTPTPANWVALLNQETEGIKTSGIEYPIISAEFWPDGAADRTADGLAEYMPLIESVAVHPDNPLRIFIGLRTSGFNATENFHQNNGVWEYQPSVAGDSWSQVKGGPVGEPCKGITKVGLVPGNPGTLVAASWGQEFFRVDVAPGTPVVASCVSLEPLHPGQPALMVQIDQPIDAAALVEVAVDASVWGQSNRLSLYDDGVSPDWVAGDGLWTADLSDEIGTLPVGDVVLPIIARDPSWNTYHGDVDVQVLAEEPTVYYRNDSRDTGATFSGLPSGIAAVDLYETDDAGIDADRDVYVSALDDGISDSDGTILLHMGLSGDVPQYRDRSDERLPNNRPLQDHGPATSADLNGDGLPDLIVPAGSSGEGLLLFEQTDGQTDEPPYVLRNPWLGDLPTALQADTWSAACGDYDGDGQLDIYVCRSTASEATGMPGPGSGALADVLLRSDMANNKEFIDDSAALEVPLDGQGQPVHLATSTAAWCDFDGDGDLDLAIADGSTAKGVFIYRNDPDTGPTRFSIVYPTDPATTPWPRSVSGMAGMDADGDGDLDLVATTHTDLTSNNGCYVLLNQGFSTAGPFAEPQLLASIPAAHQCTGFRAMDHDLDGDQDLLLLPGNADATPLLLLNAGDGTFASSTSAPGLGAMKGGTNGALVADLNGDGRAELFLGRPEATGRFFGTAVRQQGGSDHWIALDPLDERLSVGETVQVPAVGAKVVVQCGPSRQTSMLVEANGRTDHVLRIGVEAGYTPSCTVFWPSGHVTSHADLASQGINVLTAPTTVDLQLDSVTGFTELKPGEVVDWLFRWTTDVQVDMARSRILFTEPLSCQLTVAEIAAGDPHVSVKQWAGQSGGSTVYFNELRWSDRPCTQCAQTFVLETSRGGVPATSDTETIRTRLCTTLDPNNPPGGE